MGLLVIQQVLHCPGVHQMEGVTATEKTCSTHLKISAKERGAQFVGCECCQRGWKLLCMVERTNSWLSFPMCALVEMSLFVQSFVRSPTTLRALWCCFLGTPVVAPWCLLLAPKCVLTTRCSPALLLTYYLRALLLTFCIPQSFACLGMHLPKYCPSKTFTHLDHPTGLSFAPNIIYLLCLVMFCPFVEGSYLQKGRGSNIK